MGFRLGVGGRVGPLRAGVSNRGIGGGLGPASAGYAWRHRARSAAGSVTLGNIIWWLILALLLGWLVLLAAVLVLFWPMIAATAIQQAVSDSPTSTGFEIALLGPEIAWLAVLARWGIRRRQRAPRTAVAVPEPVPTAWRPWS